MKDPARTWNEKAAALARLGDVLSGGLMSPVDVNRPADEGEGP